MRVCRSGGLQAHRGIRSGSKLIESLDWPRVGSSQRVKWSGIDVDCFEPPAVLTEPLDARAHDRYIAAAEQRG